MISIKETISAGGIVRKTIDGQVNIILTREIERSAWVLPKGHVEKGETLEQAAIREVKEETGLDAIRLIQKLGIKKRLSFQGDEYKTIHYFLFDCEDVQGLENAKDDEKTLEAKCFPLDNLPKLFWQTQKDLITENTKLIRNTI